LRCHGGGKLVGGGKVGGMAVAVVVAVAVAKAVAVVVAPPLSHFHLMLILGSSPL
jgi:hypothetical protein